MYSEEEKLRNVIKITFFLLITMFGVATLEEPMVIVLLLFYIAFLKD